MPIGHGWDEHPGDAAVEVAIERLGARGEYSAA